MYVLCGLSVGYLGLHFTSCRCELRSCQVRYVWAFGRAYACNIRAQEGLTYGHIRARISTNKPTRSPDRRAVRPEGVGEVLVFGGHITSNIRAEGASIWGLFSGKEYKIQLKTGQGDGLPFS